MTLSPDDTLSKIEAMASVLATAPDDAKVALQRQYLELVGHFLVDQGRGDGLAFPLLDIIEILDHDKDEASASKQMDRRHGVANASDELLAKVAAVVDVLIAAGYSLDHACQIVTRQMITRNVQAPAGGDARAWRNMLAWRQKLINSKREGPVWSVYAKFKDDIVRLYGARLAEAAAREAIWDRRAAAKAGD